jgi:hypothetical protein
MALDPSDLRDRAVESIAGGLAQVKYLRSMKESLNESCRPLLDKTVDTLTGVLEELTTAEVNRETKNGR